MDNTIYVDITSSLNTFKNSGRLTGIQRVTFEIIKRLIDNHYDLNLIIKKTDNSFVVVNKKIFYKYVFKNANELVMDLHTSSIISLNDFRKGSIFLELDSSWDLTIDRTKLYPILKSQSVTIISLVYDIIPIVKPHFVVNTLVSAFVPYIAAVLQFSDVIITNSEFTKNDIMDLYDKMGGIAKRIEVIKLGSNFKEVTSSEKPINFEIDEYLKDSKIILSVGTIEPRKNHKYILDSFDEYLLDEGFKYVIVGKNGCHSEKFIQRLESHISYNKSIFWFKNIDDNALNYLYDKAMFLAFPSIYEGYGLPIVEALVKNTPVIASDLSIFREVGGDVCDFVSLNDCKNFADKVMEYNNNPSLYAKKLQEIKSYKVVSWEDCFNDFEKLLKSQFYSTSIEIISTNQIVVITNRAYNFCETLKHIEYYMDFITEVVVACPESIIKDIEDNYTGNYKLIFISDEELMEDIKMPDDHITRNMLLRSLLYQRKEVENYFIVFDDDYRPLTHIKMDDFIFKNKIQAHYFYDYENWIGPDNNRFSYDIGQYKTYKFLKEKCYPTRIYSSHQPQVFSKKIWEEMLTVWPEVSLSGHDEWSSFYNYGLVNYPDLFNSVPYKVLNWPESPAGLDYFVYPIEILFENYYPDLYKNNNIFEGMDVPVGKELERINQKKLQIYLEIRKEHEYNIRVNKSILGNTLGSINLIKPSISLPKKIYMKFGRCSKHDAINVYRQYFEISPSINDFGNYKYTVSYTLNNYGTKIKNEPTEYSILESCSDKIAVPIMGIDVSGEITMTWLLKKNDKVVAKTKSKLVIFDPDDYLIRQVTS